MARRSTSRTRMVAGALGMALTAGVGGGGLLLATGLLASSPAGAHTGRGAAGDGTVIVCESDTVSHGAVDTSSAVAVRVPAGTPVPPGCRSG